MILPGSAFGLENHDTHLAAVPCEQLQLCYKGLKAEETVKMALIGFGRLGSHLSQFLKEHFDIMVFDKNVSKKQVIERGFRWCSDIEKVEEADIVVPFVPISSFETTIKGVSSNLKQGSLVVDVCSVKVLPVTCMKEYLPSHIQILATTPMFGPDSSEKTLFGQKIVLCPIRIQDEFYKDIYQFLNRFGLKVIQSTPEEHDHQIANTLLLSFDRKNSIDFGAKIRYRYTRLPSPPKNTGDC